MSLDTTAPPLPTGYRNLIGLKTVALRDGTAIMELVISAEHLNSQGSLHGGVLSTMIDHAGGLAGCYCSETGNKRKAVTLSLTTSFLAAVSSGKVTATSSKRPGGRKIFVATTEISDEVGRLIAVGEATYRYISS